MEIATGMYKYHQIIAISYELWERFLSIKNDEVKAIKTSEPARTSEM
jgi:hypothetical protein